MYPVLTFMLLVVFTMYPNLALWLLALMAAELFRRWW